MIFWRLRLVKSCNSATVLKHSELHRFAAHNAMPSSAGIQLRMHGQSKGLETQAKTTRYSCEKKYNSGF